MKILISIFILFFSFSSLAGDDLTGKAVYCYKEYDTPIAASAFGIKFVSKNEAIFYLERNQKPQEELKRSYTTAAEMISVNDQYGKNLISINRKNLEVLTRNLGESDWESSYCKIVDPKELLKLFEDSFSKFKEGNIL